MTLFGPANTALAANTNPKILNYQARVTNASGVPVPDGGLSIKVAIYDSLSGGSCLYSLRGTCGVPVGFSATTTAGVFSILIGDTTQNALPDDLFDGNDRYLGITIAADPEMVPRKRIVSAPYAFNADRLDDLDSSSTGGTSAHILAATSNGNLIITGDPQGSGIGDGSVYVNPTSASAGETIFGVADNGSLRFRLNKEGDITQTGSLLATAASPTARFIFKGAASQSTDIFEVRDSSDLLALGVSATSTQIWGDLTTIRSVSYSWPSTQGGASTVLQNNGSGVLSWATVSSGVANLQAAYNAASSTTELSISGGNALTIADTLSGVGNIFEIQDLTDSVMGYYSSRYFTVSSTATTIGGNAIVNGNTTLGDASGDTLTSKFGTWNFVNNVFANLGDASLTFQSTLATAPTVSFVADALTSGTALYVSSSADRSVSGSLLRLSDSGATSADNSGLSILSSNASAAAQAITIDLDNGNNNNIVFSVTTDETTTSGTSADTEKFAILASGSVRGDGNLTIGSASGTNTVDFTGARIASNLTPTTDATFDLGDYNRRWRDLWLSGGSANIALDQSGTSIMRLGFESTEGLRGFIKTPSEIPLQLRSGNVGNSGVYITSGGTTISSLTVNDPVTIQGALLTSIAGSELTLSKTHTSAGTSMYVQSIWNLGSSGDGGNAAFFANQTLGANGNNVDTAMNGITSLAEHLGSGIAAELNGIVGASIASNGAVTDLNGVSAYALTLGSTVTTARGVTVNVGTVGGGSIAEGHGVLVTPAATLGGSITQASGITIDEQAAATDNVNLLIGDTDIPTGQWSIYNASPKANFFNGSVTFGDVTINGACTGCTGTFNLNQAYANSSATGTEIYLDSTRGALTLADSYSSFGGNLFEIQDRFDESGNYSTRYFTVSSTATEMTTNLLVTGTAGNFPEISGAGTRLMYIPSYNGAFRAGQVTGTQWNSGSVGLGSVAFGLNTTASGDYSFASGDGASATGNRGAAFGSSTTAGQDGFAMGTLTSATGSGALAMGDTSRAGGLNSLAGGFETTAAGTDSFAFGSAAEARGALSFALGQDLYTDRSWAYVIGKGAGASTPLINTTPSSLMIGFDSTTPTLTVMGKTTSGSPNLLKITGQAHTTLTASTEAIDAYFNLARTVQFATGALATQRAAVFEAPTYSFVGASTITDAATLAVTGAPVAGTNATITNPYALWIQGGVAKFDGRIVAAAHAANQGLRVPTVSGVPTAVTGQQIGDIVWDSASANFYGYDGASFVFIGGGSMTLQQAYDNYTTNGTGTTEIYLGGVRGGLTLADSYSGFGGNLFEIQDRSTTAGDWSQRFFSVSATSTLIGSASSTYALDLSGARIASNLTPTTDATFDLGDYNRRWRDLWLSGGSANIALDQSGTSIMRLGFESTNGLRGLIKTPTEIPLQLRSGNVDASGITITSSGSTISNLTVTGTCTNCGVGVTDTMQGAYDNDVNGGNVTVTTNSTDGALVIAGDQQFQVSSTGGTRLGSGALTTQTALTLNETALTTGTLLQVFGGTAMNGSAMAVISASGTASNGSNRTALYKYESTIFGGGGGSSLSDSGLNDWLVRSRIAGGNITGYHFGFRNETSSLSLQTALNIVLEQNDETSFDNVLDNLLVLDNADTSTGGSQTVTNAIRITNSGNVAGGIVTALNIDDADITTDLSLQNGETIDNNVDGIIAFGGTLTSLDINSAAANTQTILDVDASGLTSGSGLSMTAGALQTGILLKVFGGTAMSGTAMAVISASGTASNGSNRTALFKYDSTLFGGGGGSSLSDSGVHDWLVRSRVASAIVTGYHFGFRNETSDSNVVQTALNIVLEQNDETSLDNVLDNLLVLDNADTSTGGSQTVTNAIRITNSGNVAGGIVNAINIDDADITTDISLQNGETIDNNTNGTITFGSDITLNFSGTATTNGVCHSGANSDTTATARALVVCSGAPADIAEWYPTDGTPSAGDILVASDSVLTYESDSFDPLTGMARGYKDSHTVSVLGKASAPYAAKIIGVVSTSPYQVFGRGLLDATSNAAPVAVAGRVPAKVSIENGNIKAGDPITTSSAPGIGMKATKPGMIVGYALDAWNGPGQGTIEVFVNPGWSAGETIGTDGAMALFKDAFAFDSTGIASASSATLSSYALNFKSSAWDSASDTAVSRNISVLGEAATPADYQLAFRNDEGNLLAALNQAGDLSIAGSLSVEGGFDYAEMFPAVPDIEAGDIVMVDPANQNGYGVKKTEGPYENSAIGVISTKPGFLTGKTGADTQPVALAGRVPVKVNLESGAIDAGDPITSSSTPGVGMKATQAGRVIGIALQAATDDGVILAFVNPSWWNGPMPVGSASAGGSLDISQDSLLDFKDSVLSGVAAIISTDGMWGITADGHMIAKKVETETLQTEDVVLVQSEAKASTSEGVVLAGYTATVVQNPAMKPNSKVFVSFLDDPRGSYWVAEKGEGSFTVHLSTPALVDLSFEYWIVGVEDRRPSPSPVIPAEEGTQAATDTEPALTLDPAPDVIESGSGTEETGSASGTEEIGG